MYEFQRTFDREGAIDQLLKSARGRGALECLAEMFGDRLIGLDFRNQAAVLELINAFWDSPNSTAEIMHKALIKSCVKHS